MKTTMRNNFRIKHEFVEFIPNQREERTLYVSIEYATAVHNCFCGCGTKVVTPISPTGWQLIFDGETISLSPSVGNWSFACRSHYWIRRDIVIWAGDMTQERIELGRAQDQATRQAYFGHSKQPPSLTVAPAAEKKWSLWNWLSGK